MVLSYILANLLADVPKAEAVIFLDKEGEAIESLSAGINPFDLKVTGAYQGIFFKQFGKIFKNLKGFYYLGSKHSIFCVLVGGEYYLVLVTKGNTSSGLTLHFLEKARKELEEKVI